MLNENKQTPKAPNLPEYRKDDMEGFFEDVKFLTSFIGCNIFDVAKPKEEHLFYTKGRGCDASGFYDANGFTVLKGSIIAKSSVPSFTWKEKRENLLNLNYSWKFSYMPLILSFSHEYPRIPINYP